MATQQDPDGSAEGRGAAPHSHPTMLRHQDRMQKGRALPPGVLLSKDSDIYEIFPGAAVGTQSFAGECFHITHSYTHQHSLGQAGAQCKQAWG